MNKQKQSATILESLGALFLFCKNPDNRHLATWIQTFAIIGGVIVALNQLDTIAKQDLLKSNSRYLEYEKKFSSDIGRKMGVLHEHYLNRSRLNDAEFSKLYTFDDIWNTRRDVEVFINDLSACGSLGVCPKRLVDKFVCTHSKSLHKKLSKDLSLPTDWKIKFNAPVFYEAKIDEHCNIFSSSYYWWKHNKSFNLTGEKNSPSS